MDHKPYDLFRTPQCRKCSNTATGDHSLIFNTTGAVNSATGNGALEQNTTGSLNTAIGVFALNANTTGSDNTANGEGALHSNTAGNYNNANGQNALLRNTTGNYNTPAATRRFLEIEQATTTSALATQSGYFSAARNNNIGIGDAGLTRDNNVLRIRTQGTQKFTAIAGISGVKARGGAPVLVNSKGQPGVSLSSFRYKEGISNGQCQRPPTFAVQTCGRDGTKPQQYRLIAEEEARVMPELVVYDERGQAEALAYQTLTPLLLNALQKQQNQVVSTKAQFAALSTQVAEMKAVKAQDADMSALRDEVVELRRQMSPLVATRQ